MAANGKYVVKQTNKNLKAYQQYRKQAKAIWNANQTPGADTSKSVIITADQLP